MNPECKERILNDNLCSQPKLEDLYEYSTAQIEEIVGSAERRSARNNFDDDRHRTALPPRPYRKRARNFQRWRLGKFVDTRLPNIRSLLARPLTIIALIGIAFVYSMSSRNPKHQSSSKLVLNYLRLSPQFNKYRSSPRPTARTSVWDPPCLIKSLTPAHIRTTNFTPSLSRLPVTRSQINRHDLGFIAPASTSLSLPHSASHRTTHFRQRLPFHHQILSHGLAHHTSKIGDISANKIRLEAIFFQGFTGSHHQREL